jgi:futalosine hydrolase
VTTTLLVAAAPAEARAILAGARADEAQAAQQWKLLPLSGSASLLITGVGKVNAGAAVARFCTAESCGRIINLGIAGALPGTGLNIGDVVLATTSIYADEGLLTPAGFQDCAAMGFPLGGFEGGFEGSAIPADPALLGQLRPLATHAGAIATVSTCSGMDELAAQVRERTGAIAECMEGAAIAHIARRLAIPFAELRIISNTTGRRDTQKWDIPAALGQLRAVTGRVLDLL